MPAVANEEIEFALQSLITVVTAALASDTLKKDVASGIHKKGKELLEKVGKVESGVAVASVKQLIQELNLALPHNHAPYPPFATDFAENQVKNHIIAFELFLNHKLKAGRLSLGQEAPLFSDSVILWRDCGAKLTAKEAMTGLVKLIQKANTHLAENEKYPLPTSTK